VPNDKRFKTQLSGRLNEIKSGLFGGEERFIRTVLAEPLLPFKRQIISLQVIDLTIWQFVKFGTNH